MMTVFTEEEMVLLATSDTGDRAGSIAWLQELHGNMEHDPDMQELIDSILPKLDQMTDDDYSQLDFSEYDAWIEDMMEEIDQELAELPEDNTGAE